MSYLANSICRANIGQQGLAKVEQDCI